MGIYVFTDEEATNVINDDFKNLKPKYNNLFYQFKRRERGYSSKYLTDNNFYSFIENNIKNRTYSEDIVNVLSEKQYADVNYLMKAYRDNNWYIVKKETIRLIKYHGYKFDDIYRNMWYDRRVFNSINTVFDHFNIDFNEKSEKLSFYFTDEYNCGDDIDEKIFNKDLYYAIYDFNIFSFAYFNKGYNYDNVVKWFNDLSHLI